VLLGVLRSPESFVRRTPHLMETLIECRDCKERKDAEREYTRDGATRRRCRECVRKKAAFYYKGTEARRLYQAIRQVCRKRKVAGGSEWTLDLVEQLLAARVPRAPDAKPRIVRVDRSMPFVFSNAKCI